MTRAQMGLMVRVRQESDSRVDVQLKQRVVHNNLTHDTIRCSCKYKLVHRSNDETPHRIPSTSDLNGRDLHPPHESREVWLWLCGVDGRSALAFGSR